MRCPRCETTTLDEKDREGVVVDVCAQCRGMWLDRGELEKLIARAARDLDELEQQRPAAPAAAPRAPERSYPPPERGHTDPAHSAPRPRRDSDPGYYPPRSRRDSDPDYRYPQGQGHGHGHYGHGDPRYRRKKSFIESLGDIFD